jgi:hypothetical protein
MLFGTVKLASYLKDVKDVKMLFLTPSLFMVIHFKLQGFETVTIGRPFPKTGLSRLQHTKIIKQINKKLISGMIDCSTYINTSFAFRQHVLNYVSINYTVGVSFFRDFLSKFFPK